MWDPESCCHVAGLCCAPIFRQTGFLDLAGLDHAWLAKMDKLHMPRRSIPYLAGNQQHHSKRHS